MTSPETVSATPSELIMGTRKWAINGPIISDLDPLNVISGEGN